MGRSENYKLANSFSVVELLFAQLEQLGSPSFLIPFPMGSSLKKYNDWAGDSGEGRWWEGQVSCPSERPQQVDSDL